MLWPLAPVAEMLAAATGLGGAALVMASFPFHPESMVILLAMVAALGIFSGIAFGSSYQLVSRFRERESVALTTGTARPLSQHAHARR